MNLAIFNESTKSERVLAVAEWVLAQSEKSLEQQILCNQYPTIFSGPHSGWTLFIMAGICYTYIISENKVSGFRQKARLRPAYLKLKKYPPICMHTSKLYARKRKLKSLTSLKIFKLSVKYIFLMSDLKWKYFTVVWICMRKARLRSIGRHPA